eukprot:scaffold19784_cov99-Isochrysis_galbana.AAC.2
MMGGIVVGEAKERVYCLFLGNVSTSVKHKHHLHTYYLYTTQTLTAGQPPPSPRSSRAAPARSHLGVGSSQCVRRLSAVRDNCRCQPRRWCLRRSARPQSAKAARVTASSVGCLRRCSTPRGCSPQG